MSSATLAAPVSNSGAVSTRCCTRFTENCKLGTNREVLLLFVHSEPGEFLTGPESPLSIASRGASSMVTPAGKVPGLRSERRRSRRYPFDAGLEMEWGSAILKGRVRDISTDGMFVETPDPLWVRATFSARLLAQKDPLQVDCVVRRVEPGRGMGLTYAVPAEETQAQLMALLASLEKS